MISRTADEVLSAKKVEAAMLFSVWDREDEGMINVTHLVPILTTLFPFSAYDAEAAAWQREAVRKDNFALLHREQVGARSGSHTPRFTLSDLTTCIDRLCERKTVVSASLPNSYTTCTVSYPTLLEGVFESFFERRDEVPIDFIRRTARLSQRQLPSTYLDFRSRLLCSK